MVIETKVKAQQERMGKAKHSTTEQRDKETRRREESVSWRLSEVTYSDSNHTIPYSTILLSQDWSPIPKWAYTTL